MHVTINYKWNTLIMNEGQNTRALATIPFCYSAVAYNYMVLEAHIV